jgi:glycosyltransferase involved in cell wall biosynthesis
LVVPPADPEAMADALVRLWREPELRARLASAGADTVSKLTWDSSCERFQSAIEGYAGGPRLAAPAPSPPDMKATVGVTADR